MLSTAAGPGSGPDAATALTCVGLDGLEPSTSSLSVRSWTRWARCFLGQDVRPRMRWSAPVRPRCRHRCRQSLATYCLEDRLVPSYALRGCSRALLAGSDPALASCLQVAAGDGRWLLMAVRGHLGDTGSVMRRPGSQWGDAIERLSLSGVA